MLLQVVQASWQREELRKMAFVLAQPLSPIVKSNLFACESIDGCTITPISSGTCSGTTNLDITSCSQFTEQLCEQVPGLWWFRLLPAHYHHLLNIHYQSCFLFCFEDWHQTTFLFFFLFCFFCISTFSTVSFKDVSLMFPPKETQHRHVWRIIQCNWRDTLSPQTSSLSLLIVQQLSEIWPALHSDVTSAQSKLTLVISAFFFFWWPGLTWMKFPS